MVGILIFITLLTSYVIVSPADDIETVYIDQTQLNSGTGLAFGSEYVFNSANTSNISVASLTSTKFVVAYVDNDNSDYGTAVIGDVSGKTITYGAEYVFNSAGTVDVSVAALSSTKFVVVFNDTSDFGNGTAVIGDVSGNTITYGSGYVFNIFYTEPISVASLTSTQFVVAYGNPGYFDSAGFVRVGDVSGNSITYGEVGYLDRSHDKVDYISVAALLYNEIMVVYDCWGVENYMAFGNTFGIYIQMDYPDFFSMSSNIDNVSITTLAPSEFLITYTDTDDSGQGKAFMGKNTHGAWWTPEGKFVFNPDTTGQISASAISSAKFVIAYEDNGNSDYGTAMFFEHLDRSITYSSEEQVFNPDTTSSISVANLSANNFVITYEDNGNSGFGTAIIGNENLPPNNPDTPDGPLVLGVAEPGTYSTSAIDPDSNQVQYRFDWDANGTHDYSDWTSLDSSGHLGSLPNYWTIGGTYVVKAQARDEYNLISNWSSRFTVNILSPPLTPSVPSGDTSIQEYESATYFTSAIDPNDDRVQYRFDWDDGTISDWTSLVDSGQLGSMPHSWNNIHGKCYVRSQARDEHGYESGWSSSLTVTIIESKPPVADANGPYSGKPFDRISFDGSGSYGTDGTIISYKWDFGDGHTSSEVNPTYIYDYVGDYVILLTVTDDRGKTDTDETLAEIGYGSPPIVQLIYPNGGEILKDTIIVEWSVHDLEDGDNLPIHLFYYDDGHLHRINDILDNDGEYYWDTTTLPDGEYKLLIEACDSDDHIRQDSSDWFTIKNHDEPPENNPPNKPSKPIGVTSGKTGEKYSYYTSTTDIDGDQLWYKWNWGDDNETSWIGPFPSYEICEASYIWVEKNDYEIKVKAKDVYGAESLWSDPLAISMPKNKAINPFLLFFERLMERFPILEQILQPIYDKLTGF